MLRINQTESYLSFDNIFANESFSHKSESKVTVLYFYADMHVSQSFIQIRKSKTASFFFLFPEEKFIGHSIKFWYSRFSLKIGKDEKLKKL